MWHTMHVSFHHCCFLTMVHESFTVWLATLRLYILAGHRVNHLFTSCQASSWQWSSFFPPLMALGSGNKPVGMCVLTHQNSQRDAPFSHSSFQHHNVHVCNVWHSWGCRWKRHMLIHMYMCISFCWLVTFKGCLLDWEIWTDREAREGDGVCSKLIV